MKTPVIRLLLLLLLALPLWLQAQPAAKPKFKDAAALRSFFHWEEGKAPLISAHRGGPAPGIPENSMAAFKNTAKNIFALLETDIAKSSDGVLYLMHDNTLERTTTGQGKTQERDWAYLRKLRLKDAEGTVTRERVPSLAQALRWAKGKAVLSLDIKRGTPIDEVVGAVQQAKAQAYAMLIAYTLEDAQTIHRLDPSLLISVSLMDTAGFERFQATGLPAANTVAFTGTSLKAPGFYQMLHSHGIRCIIGTMGNLDKSAAAKGGKVYVEIVTAGADILATDRPLEAEQALKAAGLK